MPIDHTVENAQDYCTTCGQLILKGETFFMCDETMGTYHGGPCWDNTPCAKGEHGEGCPTMVIQ